MEEHWDGLLMAIIAAIVIFISYRSLNTWVRKPLTLRSRLGFDMNEDIVDHPAVHLLERSGYEVVSDKLKVPLAFKINDSLLHSRLFIDYIVLKDGEFYLVRTARDRSIIEWTGSGVRAQFLSYLLLYPECAGVLYIDADRGEIKEITLTTDDDEEE
ncbi:hypothetical protein D3C80_1588290 [compost metagenome]